MQCHSHGESNSAISLSKLQTTQRRRWHPSKLTYFSSFSTTYASLLFQIPVRECARILWMGAPSWEKGDRIPKVGTRSVSWAQTREERKRDRMRRRREVKEDDPFMASRCQHAQSKLVCIAWEEASECSGDIVFVVLIVFIVSGK